MSLPLDLLVDETENIYELTCAMIKRAMQITMTGHEDLDSGQEKIVSTAINQLLTKKVEFRNEV